MHNLKRMLAETSQLDDPSSKKCADLIEQIASSLQALRTQLQRESMVVHGLRRVPFRDTATTSIDLVHPVDDAQAKSWAIEGLTSVHYAEGQDANETLRIFGAIEVSKEAVTQIESVNSIKNAFRDYVVKKIPKRNRDKIYKMFPTLNVSQLRRRIQFIETSSLVSFRMEVGSSVDRLTAGDLRNEWLKQLRDMTGDEQAHFDRLPDTSVGMAEYKLKQDYLHISQIPSEELLAEYRPVRAHVRAYVSGCKEVGTYDGSGRGRYYQAPMPLVGLHGTFKKVTFANVDKTQVTRDTQKSLSSLLERSPLLKYRPIYRYLPHAREFKKGDDEHAVSNT